MKKVIRLSESDLVRLVQRVINEQFDGEINTTHKSGENELKQRLESLKSEMERSLKSLKSSGTEIDAQRFLKEVRNKSNEIFFDVNDKSDTPVRGFAEMQQNLINHFRKELKSS